MNTKIISYILLNWVLIACNFTQKAEDKKPNTDDRVVTHTIKTKIPYAFEFNLKGTFIIFKANGVLTNGGVLYIQSYEPNTNIIDSWIKVNLKKGKINYVDDHGIETYVSRGRIIYVPNGYLNPSVETKADSLSLYIETAYSTF